MPPNARVVCVLAFAIAASVLAGDAWSPVTLTDPRQGQLGGRFGSSLQRGLARLSQPPYTAEWLLSDVSFQVRRIFTNYSGDVSGRFLELASLTSARGDYSPPTLPLVAAEISRYQKESGYFGLDMDFAKPIQKMSPPIPMLWGNARLLVGLVTAAEELGDPKLLAAARRLGDFYIATADVFCSPGREAELRATGTGGDGYTCCYFPAIESLAMLYRATREDRYLVQARRMAEWFKKFDALPVDHSHGNLCAWRGILDLYEITGEPSYLERALAKWETAVQDGFVWPLGGVGEHWYRFHSGDEGCSESDWLRFNLQLWRFTGQTRFLDMAERLLCNQYAGNQCANGGYGWRPFDGDAEGPIGTTGNLDEWYFCCSFHGPLGLHFLRSYLAATSRDGLFVNFPLDFTSTVKHGDAQFRIAVRERPKAGDNEQQFEIELRPLAKVKSGRTPVWIRKPSWARHVRLTTGAGRTVAFAEQNGYLRIERDLRDGEILHAIFKTGLRLERRRFQPVVVAPDRISRWRDVAVSSGPDVLFATPAQSAVRMILLALISNEGQLELFRGPDGALVSLRLPAFASGIKDVCAALEQAEPVALNSESNLRTRRRAAFMHDVIAVPARLLPSRLLKQFAERASQTTPALSGGAFGGHLENNPDAWLFGSGWNFASNALHIVGGDVGLLDFQPGADYRFEFDLELLKEGQGIAGWVVRAQSPADCILFQLQSADSTYDVPEYKTRPNTLRPHVRRSGEWKIAEPIALPKNIRRGETHHVAVECRGPHITVFLDGEKIYGGDDGGTSTGTVGFRSSGPAEQAIFRNISLSR